MIRLTRLALPLCAALLVVACSRTGGPSTLEQLGGTPPDAQEYATLRDIAATPESLRSFLAGVTSKSYNILHGTQIEYLAADGRSFLIYPEATTVVQGLWQTRAGPDGLTLMCFQYGANITDPVTGEGAGEWSCRDGALYLYVQDELRDGDILDLSRTISVRPLPAGPDIPLNSAATAMGRAPFSSKNKVTWSWNG